MNKVKCAIYVRKSTEKGLEQEFNSLNNQEDACKAYVMSQAFNNWEHCKTFEDGGISGGTMKRPALMEMIEEIKKGNINTVVVYKLDRLSRSILDFHNMMKTFEKHNCNFVSITQAFDTSTSMGKLTLNMLLSFAQFEREISSERVKDKIYNSKKKGLWTGGLPPLGYDIIDKKLEINELEAEQVNIIFKKYLELGSISRTLEFLRESNIKNKSWIMKNGKFRQGAYFYKSTLNNLLKNRIYIGDIENKASGEYFKGEHKAIILQELWNETQILLKENKTTSEGKRISTSYPLTGLIKNKFGEYFRNISTKRKGITYRYYYLDGLYLSAGKIENIASDISEKFGCKSEELFEKIFYTEDDLLFYIRRDNKFLNENLLQGIEFKESICKTMIFIEKSILNKKFLTIDEVNKNIILALSQAWRYRGLFENGKSMMEIVNSENISHKKFSKYLDLAYMSPMIINSLMDNNNPKNLGIEQLTRIAKYVNFKDQEKIFF